LSVSDIPRLVKLLIGQRLINHARNATTTAWHRLISSLSKGLALIVASTAPAAATPPQLFFYPPPVQLADNSVISSPVTFSADQITTLFPEIDEMSGVVLLINWSQLCPDPDKCDFSLIDQVLSYWGARGKKVILGVATVGYPYRSVEGGKAHYVSATPDWVLDQIDTYVMDSLTLGWIDNQTSKRSRFPSYADPRFAKLIAVLVHRLARYDGNPAISQIRISTGFLTEDNSGPRWFIPNYTDLDWTGYCRQMANLFQREFHRSQLELDLGLLGLVYQRGGPKERAAVDQLMAELIAQKTFLAFDGLQSSTIDALDPRAKQDDEEPRILYYLKLAGAKYGGLGLEAMEPISDDRMQDVKSLAAVVKALKPSRLVLFPDAAGSLSRERRGTSPQNALATGWLDVQPNAASANAHIHELLTSLGYR
jgi:hypothetical protein